MTRRAALSRPLRDLARAWGVTVSYTGCDGRRVTVTPDALVGVLRALGAPIDTPDGAHDALAARAAASAVTMLDPVTVAWDRRAPALDVRAHARDADAPVRFDVALADGRRVEILGETCGVETREVSEVDGRTTVVRRFTFPEPLPHGAHRLTATLGARQAEATLLCSPSRAYTFGIPRAWGVFAPVYALRTTVDDALPGDLGDLDALAAWAHRYGATVVGTLPLLAAFLDEPYEPSPYAPVSRLFWNEVYVDTTRLPGLATTDRVRTPSPVDGLVDLHTASARRRPLLECAAEQIDAADPAFRSFVERHPRLESYARFRAAVEQHGVDWSRWPAAWRRDGIPDDAVEPARVRYHRYAQFAVDEQLADLATGLRSRGQALYLDFPLGSHRHGFDVWAERDLFVADARVGAPPDEFFSRGQDWGFPPVHPERSRADGHAHFAACLDHHLAHAGLLRLDHVMGLRRLWWVPPGHDAADGAYVRYPVDELYARLCLASVEHGAAVSGENLGTVPPAVNRELRRHGLGGMHIMQFELDADAPGGVRPPPAGSLTSLDTHDTATFAGFWTDVTLDDRVGMGLASADEVDRLRKERAGLRHDIVAALREQGLLQARDGANTTSGVDDEPGTVEVMAALLELLGRSDAAIVLVALEDLWCEPHGQNTPGTVSAENWRRPAAHALDELAGLPGLVDALRRLDAARGGS